jgi:predicted nucleic acid-binding protein
VKLLAEEPESVALRAYVRSRPEQASSVVLDAEAHRVAARLGPAATARAGMLLGALTLVPLNPEVRALARNVGPATLRTLDAIHLASAVGLGTDLGVFVAYDQRLLDAATAAGLPVAAPA